jgi:hypothetical protein
LEKTDARVVSDALMVTIHRIETMPGPWPSVANETAAAVRRQLFGHSDALKAYLSLPDGHIEMRAVDAGPTPHRVIRANRGFEPDGDPYVVIIGPRSGEDRLATAVLLRRP